jgi:hypothetical protein
VSQHNGYIGPWHSSTHALSIDRPSPQHTVKTDGITGTAADWPEVCELQYLFDLPNAPHSAPETPRRSRTLYPVGCPAQVRTAVMTTPATSLGWEIMTTCEAPSISVTVAPMRW